MTYIIGTCENTDECGWEATVAKIIPASRTEPSYPDMDVPDCCPDCGGEITTDTSESMPEMEDY